VCFRWTVVTLGNPAVAEAAAVPKGLVVVDTTDNGSQPKVTKMRSPSNRKLQKKLEAEQEEASSELAAFDDELVGLDGKEEWYWYKGEAQARGNVVHAMVDPYVESLPDEAFCGCKFLVEIQIPSKIFVSIGNRAFYGCTALVAIKMLSKNSSMTSIGQNAFQHCSSLRSIIVPDSVQSIGAGSFLGCTALTQIQLYKGTTRDAHGHSFKSGLREIPDELFRLCENLQNVTLPMTVESIGAMSFSGCFALTKLEIPDAVVDIKRAAFRHCKNLEWIRLPKYTLTTGGSKACWACIEEATFEGCESLVNVELPGTIETIQDSAFRGCSSLACVLIPKRVKDIGYEAFQGCTSLKTVWLMSTSLKGFAIRDNTFNDCPALETIDLAKLTPTLSNSA